MWCHDKVGRRIHRLGTLVAIRGALFSRNVGCWGGESGGRGGGSAGSQLGWLTICQRISSPSSDFDVSQVRATFRIDGSMPRSFMISRRRTQESRTGVQTSKTHMLCHCDYKPSDDWCIFVFVSTTSIRRRKNVKRNARQVTFLEDQNPPRGYAVISTNSSVSTSNATYLQTRNAKGSELQIYEGIPAVSAFLSLAGPMQARRPSSSESVTQQSSPKFSIPRALRFVLYKHYAIDWFYWQIDLSELNPTAKVIKNFFVIVSYSTSDSEESTTLRMKWYLTVTQDMSSMTLVALKQVEH